MHVHNYVGTGSQPTSWQFQYDDGSWQMCDDHWHEELNKLYEGRERQKVLWRQDKKGRWSSFLVVIRDFTCVNRKSLKQRQIRPVHVEVLMEGGPDHGQGWRYTAADIPALSWQVEVEGGWKNLAPVEAEELTQMHALGHDTARLVHRWVHPKSGKSMGILQEFCFKTMTQTSWDKPHATRRIRLTMITLAFGGPPPSGLPANNA